MYFSFQELRIPLSVSAQGRRFSRKKVLPVEEVSGRAFHNLQITVEIISFKLNLTSSKTEAT
jgi:hypothetical protein